MTRAALAILEFIAGPFAAFVAVATAAAMFCPAIIAIGEVLK